MTIRTIKYLSLSFGLLSTTCAVLSFFVMFKAGCTGDTKSGALGDPIRALQLEELSLLRRHGRILLKLKARALAARGVWRCEAVKR